MFAIELSGAASSALGIWLMTRRRRLGWPITLVATGLYAWVFVDARLYSDALLQGAFAIMIVYGWLRWSRHLGEDGRVRIAALPCRRALGHLALGAVGALALGSYMHWQTNAALPWLDAALTAFSLVGQWWQARRHVAAWWLWIAVDLVYVGMFVYKELFVTALLYAGFVAIAAAGLREWTRAARA